MARSWLGASRELTRSWLGASRELARGLASSYHSALIYPITCEYNKELVRSWLGTGSELDGSWLGAGLELARTSQNAGKDLAKMNESRLRLG